jgi:hypothetical protein
LPASRGEKHRKNTVVSPDVVKHQVSKRNPTPKHFFLGLYSTHKENGNPTQAAPPAHTANQAVADRVGAAVKQIPADPRDGTMRKRVMTKGKVGFASQARGFRGVHLLWRPNARHSIVRYGPSVSLVQLRELDQSRRPQVDRNTSRSPKWEARLAVNWSKEQQPLSGGAG